MPLDFAGLAAQLLSNAWDLLPRWLPGGKNHGRNYMCRDLTGGDGDSFSVNLDNGIWKQFGANKEQVFGGDLISLYAAINNLTQGEAYKALSYKYDYEPSGVTPPVRQEVAQSPVRSVSPPPANNTPNTRHSEYGDPSNTWTYRDSLGKPIYYVARYETPTNGKPAGKQFRPFSWDGDRWVNKSPPSPRPLYGLDLLANRPNAPVLLTEGEKACDAARVLLGDHFVCMTWPNGVLSIKVADFTPLYGKNLVLWPDNDDAGIKAMEQLAEMLCPHCPQIKIIYPTDMEPGADLADCSTWNTKDAIEFAKPRAVIWGQEPERTERTERTELTEPAQLEHPVTAPIPAKAAELDESLVLLYRKAGIAITEKGAPITNANNVYLMMSHCAEFKDAIWFDEFFSQPYTTITGRVAPWIDDFDSLMLTGLQGKYGFHHLNKAMVRDAMARFLLSNRKNSVKDWLLSLKWDGKPRVAEFFKTYYNSTQNQEYVTAVSRNFWVSMAARVFNPGCKADHMVILEGGQGTFKSSSLNIIGGDWFAEIHDDMGSKDFALALQGKLLIEIAELESFRKSADVTLIKKTISCQVDRVRSPYNRRHQDLPRQCIFVGTTNEDEYLHDTTGNRRYWPIKCGAIELELIRQDREQLFAEAVQMYQNGVNWHEVPKEHTEAEQLERVEEHPWVPKIEAWLEVRSHNQNLVVRPDIIAEDCLKIDVPHLTPFQMKVIRAALKQLGWTANHVAWQPSTGKPIKVWKKSSG